MQGGANVNLSDDSNTCLFAPAPYYQQNKGFFLGFLFKPLGGPPRGLNEKASEKYPLFITYVFFTAFLHSLTLTFILCLSENRSC